MASSSDIRDWLRGQGREVPANGRLRKADQEAYYQAHPDSDGAGPDDVTYPGPGGPDSDAADTGEQPPSRTRTTRGRAGTGWLRGGRKAKKTGGAKERRTFPRVPVDKLIEHAWADMAWAAQTMPPLSRMLEAQAPLAGMIFEDVVRDTAADKALQPAARLEDKLDKTYGMLFPPLYVLGVMATAPAPGAEPSVAHKAAFVGLRHSLLVMARIGGASLKEVEQRGKENAARQADVDGFIRYLFDIPDPEPEPGGKPPDAQAQVLYASATLGAADAPV